MQNSVVILRHNDGARPRHGGGVEYYRVFHGFINGQLIEVWKDGFPPHYERGKSLDFVIVRWVRKNAVPINAVVARGEYKDRIKMGDLT